VWGVWGRGGLGGVGGVRVGGCLGVLEGVGGCRRRGEGCATCCGTTAARRILTLHTLPTNPTNQPTKPNQTQAAQRPEDFSDMVAAQAALQKKKLQQRADAKAAKKTKGGASSDFKF